MIPPLAMLTFLAASLAAGLRAPAPPPPAAKEVAIVSFLAGQALREDHGVIQPLRLWDRLTEGTWLEVNAGRVGLAFASGKRYVLLESARALLGKKDFAGASHFLELPRVKPRAFGPIFAGTPMYLTEIAGTPIRTERIRGLYPRLGAATPAGHTTLRFDAVDNAGRYQVEVFDEEGKTVFATPTTDVTVSVPTAKLRAGVRYSWRVRTLDRPGPAAAGQADFVTLTLKVAREWEAMRRELGHGEESLPLLALIDQKLGLFAEARTDLEEAIRQSPEEPGLREALSQIEARLSEEDGSRR